MVLVNVYRVVGGSSIVGFLISFIGSSSIVRDEAIRGWRNWLREDPLVRLYR